MNLTVHKVPRQTFARLAQGGGGPTAVRRLRAAQRSKHTLMVRRVVGLARSAGSAAGEAAKRAYDQLAAIQEARPDAVGAVLAHPAVGAWARHTVDVISAAENGSGGDLSWLSGLAAAAAIRGRIPFSAGVPVADGQAMLPSLGCAATTVGRVRVTDAGAEIDGIPLPDDLDKDAAGWQGLRRLSAAARGQRAELIIDDLDPYRAPGVDNLAGRLAAAEAERWQSCLDDAWELLTRNHAPVAEEIAVLIRVFTPLRPRLGGHESATSRHAFGTILLSAPPDASALAVTMVHEVQHAKLCALLDLVPMTLPDDGRRFYAPWREDPRPVSGLLQGAYAFLGVAGFWLRQGRLAGEEAAIAEFARWLSAVRTVVDTLSQSGGLTSAGLAFVSGMEQTLGRWEAERLPGATLAAAHQANQEHRERWRQRNGEIPVSAG